MLFGRGAQLERVLVGWDGNGMGVGRIKGEDLLAEGEDIRIYLL